MPSACFKIRNVSWNCRYGFTLVEILIVIAMIALIAGIAVSQMDDVDPNEKPLEHWVLDAIFSARLQALETKEKAVLYYDKEVRAFQIKGNEAVTQTIKVPPNHPEEISVSFFPLLSGEALGSFTVEYGEEPIEEIAFYSSGASVPVRINIRKEGGDELRLTPDPFASYFNTEDE